MISFGSLATLGAFGALVVASPVHVTVTAATHTPKINTHWAYTLKASTAGKPASGKLTVQIVDPIGGVHPVEFGANNKQITNIPFKGKFSDYMVFPVSSRGVPLSIRFTVHFKASTKIVSYRVTPGG